MPAVILPAFPPPDSNVPLARPKHHCHIAQYLSVIVLASSVVIALLLLVTPRLLAALTKANFRGEGQHFRKDYRREVLARPSGSGGVPAGARIPALNHKRRGQAITWLTDSAVMEEKSRGVSSNAANNISTTESPSGPELSRRPSPSSPEALNGGGLVQSTMEGISWTAHRADMARDATPAFASSDSSIPRASSALGFSLSTRHLSQRPPPPPPLTPPTLSAAVFPFEDRRASLAHSIPAELETLPGVSFIHQPNPDYMASSSAAEPGSAPSTPRRRSYTKTLPIGIPTGSNSQDAFSGTSDAPSPASFPSQSPLLPPPPPGHHDDMHGGLEIRGEIDVHGEIISVVDDGGAGWTRHTRVYGGGVCLACLANGGGGFYGDKVPPEHRR